MVITPDEIKKGGLSANASARVCEEALRLCVGTRIPLAPEHKAPSKRRKPESIDPLEHRQKPAPLGTLPRAFLQSLHVKTPLGDGIEGDKVIVSIDTPIRDEVRGYESRFNQVTGFLQGLMAPKEIAAAELETPGGAVIMERADLIAALNKFAELYRKPYLNLPKRLAGIESSLGRA